MQKNKNINEVQRSINKVGKGCGSTGSLIIEILTFVLGIAIKVKMEKGVLYLPRRKWLRLEGIRLSIP